MEIKANNLVIRALTTEELSSYINEPEALGTKMGLKRKGISQGLLKKYGFKHVGRGEEGMLFEKENTLCG